MTKISEAGTYWVGVEIYLTISGGNTIYASIPHDQNVPLIMNKNFKINYINRYRMLQIIFKCCGVVCNISRKKSIFPTNT